MIIFSAYIHDCRVMYVNKDAIDPAVEALLAQDGERPVAIAGSA